MDIFIEKLLNTALKHFFEILVKESKCKNIFYEGKYSVIQN